MTLTDTVFMEMIDKRRGERASNQPSDVTPLQKGGWHAEDFHKVTNEELARLASIDVLESEAYFELWRRTYALVSDIVHHRIHGQDARHTVTAFYCHKLPRVLHQFKPRTHQPVTNLQT